MWSMFEFDFEVTALFDSCKDLLYLVQLNSMQKQILLISFQFVEYLMYTRQMIYPRDMYRDFLDLTSIL